jgi:hypothetical protein
MTHLKQDLPYLIAILLILAIGCENQGKTPVVLHPVDTVKVDTAAWVVEHSEIKPILESVRMAILTKYRGKYDEYISNQQISYYNSQIAFYDRNLKLLKFYYRQMNMWHTKSVKVYDTIKMYHHENLIDPLQ